MPDTIHVTGPGDDHKVILWERDEAHPDGEIFVVNDGKVYEVAATAAIKRRLADGRLLQTGAKAKSDAPKTEETPTTPRTSTPTSR